MNNKHIWLGISKTNNLENYIKKNEELINIVKEESKNKYKNIQDFVILENNYLMPLDRAEGGFCRKIIETDGPSLKFKENEISQLRWYTHYDSDFNIGWKPDPQVYLKKMNLHNIGGPKLDTLNHERNSCQKLWGFHYDGIELCNGWGNPWCKKPFNDEELKQIGNSIKKYIKEKHKLVLEVKLKKSD